MGKAANKLLIIVYFLARVDAATTMVAVMLHLTICHIIYFDVVNDRGYAHQHHACGSLGGVELRLFSLANRQ